MNNILNLNLLTNSNMFTDECSKRCRLKVKAQFNRLRTILQDNYLTTEAEKEAANSWTRFQLVAHVIAYIKHLRRVFNLPSAPPLHQIISADAELEVIKHTDTSFSSPSAKSSSSENENTKPNSNWKSCAAYRNRLNKALKILRELLDQHSPLIAASRSASRAGLLDATADYIDQLQKGKYAKQVLNKPIFPMPTQSDALLKRLKEIQNQQNCIKNSIALRQASIEQFRPLATSTPIPPGQFANAQIRPIVPAMKRKVLGELTRDNIDRNVLQERAKKPKIWRPYL